ncbi:MAG: S41 family peptidase [Firmicutes bacterium]|nr:S41 family peptidase [Bacillota bacterium]
MKKFKKIAFIIIKVITIIFALIGITAIIMLSKLLKTPTELLTAISTYQLIESQYYDTVNNKNLIEGISQGLTAALNDPYSVYYTKSEITEFNTQLNGEYAGIGMVLGFDKETQLVKAIRVFKDSPAEKIGLLPGDIIVAIDGKSSEGMDTENVANTVRGEEGSQIKLVVFRDNNYLEFDITREIIRIPTVTYKFLDNDILYVQISSFNESTTSEFQNMLSSLEKNPKKVILDLRDNGGGLVDQSIQIARYFIPGGVVMYETSRDRNTLQTFSVDDQLFLDLPLVVLVNENSASASEILAGAIQDHKSGTLIGDITFGKAVVQTVFPLPTGGALKLTTQRYLTPDKRDINKVGLTPDVIKSMTVDEYSKIDYSNLADVKNDLQLVEGINYLK